jgi:hypothetical protein
MDQMAQVREGLDWAVLLTMVALVTAIVVGWRL